MPYRFFGDVAEPVPEFVAIERFFAAEHLRADRYERALAEVDAGPEGWLTVADWLGIDVAKLAAEDGKVINLTALLDGLTAAGRTAAAVNAALRIVVEPIDADDLSTTTVEHEIHDETYGLGHYVCVVRVGVVPTYVLAPSA